jgi:sigma-B regulation protein RsbU (phosphoserine phosphatase)
MVNAMTPKAAGEPMDAWLAPQSFTVLVVDDTSMHRHIVARTLGKEGYRVMMAGHGAEGRQLAFASLPDLIILDILLPDENGFDTLRWLKDNARTASIPVIFVTGQDDIGSKVKGFELGAVDYIVKPFQPSEVRARVRLHLQLRRAMHAMLASQAEKLKQLSAAQAAMLVTPAELPAACFSVYYASLHEAGGDFYDVVQISPDICGYFVADVSGHDIRTSFLTAALKALLKQNSAPIYQPLETMRMLNRVLGEILPAEKYLTACYIRLNRQTNTISVVHAGHPPILYLPVQGPARFLEARGDVLGIFPEVYLEQQEFEVTRGDRFLLYSDGLIERPEEHRTWPQCMADLLAVSEQLRALDVAVAAERLVTCLGVQTRTLQDDIVALVFEV